MTKDINLVHEQPLDEEKIYNILCVGIGGTGVIRASMILAWSALREGFKVRTAETHGMSQRGGSVSSFLRFGKKIEGPFMIKGDLDILIAFEISEALRNLEYINDNTFLISSTNAVIPPSVLTHRKLKVDWNKCIGCGNCVAHCIPNRIYLESSDNDDSLTLVTGPTRQVRNGYSNVLESCTGCTNCIIDNVCPTDAITAYNEFEYLPADDIKKELESSTQNSIIIDANKIAIEAGNVLAANVVILGIIAGLEIIPINASTLKNTVKNFVPRKALEINLKAFEMGVEIGMKYQKRRKQ
ncbi:MAG: 2-oxoacid:acceptor oxidoreductase family protein [Promethearchaeota archaeon]